VPQLPHDGSAPISSDDVIALQRVIGNRAMTQLLQRSQSRTPHQPHPAQGSDLARILIQRKLVELPGGEVALDEEICQWSTMATSNIRLFS